MGWLLQQAQSASPLFAVGCLIGIGVLWRQHVKDQKTILMMSEANGKAMAAVSIAIEKGTLATEHMLQLIRDLPQHLDRGRRTRS